MSVCTCMYVIWLRDSLLHMMHNAWCWRSFWGWPHPPTHPYDITLAVTLDVFKSSLPGNTAVIFIPFWQRQSRWLFLCQASAACTPGSWYSEQNQGICIIHYSRCGTERRHRCPGHCGRTSMSKKPKVKKQKQTTNNLFLFFCVDKQLPSISSACTFSLAVSYFMSAFVCGFLAFCNSVCNDISVTVYILSLLSIDIGIYCQKCTWYK